MNIPLAQAARELGTSPESLRRWIREGGCPAVEGGRGRGKGYRVDLAAVRAWRSRSAVSADLVRDLSSMALDFWRRGHEPGELGQRVLGITNPKAAGLLVLFVGYVGRRLQIPVDSPELALLAELARQGIGHDMTDSV